MSKKLRLVLNIGSVDNAKLGLKPEQTKEGTIINANDEQAAILLKNGWAVPPGEDAPPRSTAGRVETETETDPAGKGAGAEEGDEETSPVSDTNADEAIASIQGMRSKNKLQSIIDTDPRVTVKNAAQARLDSLG